MPTTVWSKQIDLCIEAFNKQVDGNMSRKAFQIRVAAMRSAEKAGVTLTDAMEHAPIESSIFNSYKSMVKKSEGEEKKMLKKMGSRTYHQLVTGLRKNKTTPLSGAGLLAAQTLQDVVCMAQASQIYLCAECYMNFIFWPRYSPTLPPTPHPSRRFLFVTETTKRSG